jgi:pimeloyl-ACP methyl ester carboxylesterase
MNVQSHVTSSTDGVPIHYDVQGKGATALVFVHGWCCNRHYWDRQVGHFAPHYTVVCLDLAGHGASGRNRTRWTVPAFGQDVVAVVEQLGLGQVVLIGHSMGGPVIVEAARRLPTAVIGLVGVDTWQNVQQTRTPAQVAELVLPFRTNFVEAARAYVRTMFVPTSAATLAEDIVAAMSAAPPHIAISVVEEFWGHDRMLQEGLQEVKASKITINAAHWRATNMEAAQHYGIEVVLMSDVGHFVMMEDPQTFNRLLDEAVKNFIHTKVSQPDQQTLADAIDALE